MRGDEIVVRASRDEEASVWVAESDDVPGLVTEASTVEDLLAKPEAMVRKLLELNGVATPAGKGGEIPFLFVTRRATKPMRTTA